MQAPTATPTRRWDFFVSHASEDKEIAWALARELRQVGYNHSASGALCVGRRDTFTGQRRENAQEVGRHGTFAIRTYDALLDAATAAMRATA